MTELKLKTLKELDKFTLENDGYPGGAGGYLSSVNEWNPEESNADESILFKKSDLKQEAIKWINEPYEYIGDGEYRFTNSGMRFRWKDWIKHFFNISDKELE